jgi:hypothetical protein
MAALGPQEIQVTTEKQSRALFEELGHHCHRFFSYSRPQSHKIVVGCQTSTGLAVGAQTTVGQLIEWAFPFTT